MTIFTDIATLIARITLGAILLAHGIQMFTDLAGTADSFTALGVPLPAIAAPLTAAAEAAAGALLILGLLTSIAGIIAALVMAGAGLSAHLSSGIFVTDGGWELVGAIGAGALLLAGVGAGRLSVDALLQARRTATVAA